MRSARTAMTATVSAARPNRLQVKKEQFMSDNKLTRRDFLQSGSVMAAGAVSSVLGLAGCLPLETFSKTYCSKYKLGDPGYGVINKKGSGTNGGSLRGIPAPFQVDMAVFSA